MYKNDDMLSQMESYTIERRGTTIYYWITQRDYTKPLVIFTHGASLRIAYRNMSRIFRMMPESTLRKKFAEGMGVTKDVQNYALNTNKQLTRDEFIEIMDGGVRAIYEDPHFGNEYTIEKPFLLTHGEKDSAERGAFVKKAPNWAKRELNCQYEVIPNAGHNANQDNPAYFNDVLLHFLERL